MRKLLYLLLALLLSRCASDDASNISLGPGTGTGIGGSTARFTIKDDYLYIATDSRLKVLRVSDAAAPELVNDLPLFFGLETIFSYQNNLFIGSNDAVYIYSLADPAFPKYLTRFVHQTACDPVIAYGNFAYITVRDGQTCRGAVTNQLITIDISDLEKPVQKDVIEMVRPRGLTIFNGDLYVGEGIYGLKKFDISVGHKPELDTFYTEIACNDLIALPERLIITENSGVGQYLLENDSLKLLSKIE